MQDQRRGWFAYGDPDLPSGIRLIEASESPVVLGDIRALTLMSDYCAGTPLWITAGGNLADLTPLGLPQELVESLLGWQRHFDHRFSYDREPGWDHPASAAWYPEEGVRLGDELKQALPDVEVILDLWPVTNQPHSQ